jgi:hypothetical protein
MTQQANPQEPYDKLLGFFKALGDVDRLKIAGLLAQRPASVVDLARTLDLRETDVVHHLARLEEMGLVRAAAGETLAGETPAWAPDEGALLRLKKGVFTRLHPSKRVQEGGRDWEQKLLDTFVVDGRLMGIPAQYKRRVAITKWLAARFEPGMRYAEKEVNEIIQRVHHDSSSLRRYMIDYGFMQRDHGVYWRVPGRLDAKPAGEA